MTNITLGQYFPGNSAIHRLDPRTKILLMLLYIVVVFFVNTLTMFLLPLLFVIGVTSLANVPIRYVIRSIKPLRFLLIFMFVLNLFLTPGETVIWSWWILELRQEALAQAIFITLRLVFLVSGTSLMTLTTSPLSLTAGLEQLLKPLSKLRFPAHELAMMMTIALRFIPTLMEEADKIKKAQMARGADFESGNIINRAKSMIPILVPLFVSAFRRADELAMAMESRCYHGGEGRTRMRVLKFHAADAIAALIVVGM
ncbi:energy-coupling factor transporter transmembrane protein EcfT, partial [Christensenellaceae bacterium OttesenSCG-928-M15]|nr:energy-coupling factor transporter transmembrane protein EcfT [Christensenellaceae bacterium OttesenSCG-928-M15]